MNIGENTKVGDISMDTVEFVCSQKSKTFIPFGAVDRKLKHYNSYARMSENGKLFTATIAYTYVSYLISIIRYNWFLWLNGVYN